MKSFEEKYNYYKDLFEQNLYEYIDKIDVKYSNLADSIKYSVKAGGKRVRPILMLAISDILNVDFKKIMPFCISLELIHTYSLIHDDLPAMDNDDYRRGKPTNHKVYGEAMSILAGDGLLNLAYENILRNVNSTSSVNASRILSNFAGIYGMIGGQALDVYIEKTSENSNNFDKEEILNYIHENKTSKLIMCACMIPSCFCEDKFMQELKLYAKNIGLLFQIVDDILDTTSSFEKLGKTINKDLKENKLTFVSLYGIDKAKELANVCYNNSIKAIENIENSQFLQDFSKYLLERDC